MQSLLTIIDQALMLYMWAVILSAALSLLFYANVLNHGNRLIISVERFLFAVTNPALQVIRRFVPIFGGVDISPLLLVFALHLLRLLLREYGPL